MKSAINRIITITLVLQVFCLGCKGRRSKASDIKTNLGEVGNQKVSDVFKLHQKDTHKTCRAVGSGKRVIVTGFGLFSGVDFNISGLVVSSMADAKFWPTDDRNLGSIQNPVVSSGVLKDTDHGVQIVNRSMVINGESYEVCFLTLDVLWDLAASIIIYQSELFKPELVMMSGRGSTVDVMHLENGAVNRAMKLSGYDSSGTPDSDNSPEDDKIIEDIPLYELEMMTWDNVRLQSKIQPIAKKIDIDVIAEKYARSGNTYICNNVSYAVLNALQGKRFTLAGKLIGINKTEDTLASVIYSGSNNVKIGFFHYPPYAGSSVNEVRTWAEVIAGMIDASLHQ